MCIFTLPLQKKTDLPLQMLTFADFCYNFSIMCQRSGFEKAYFLFLVLTFVWNTSLHSMHILQKRLRKHLEDVNTWTYPDIRSCKIIKPFSRAATWFVHAGVSKFKSARAFLSTCIVAVIRCFDLNWMLGVPLLLNEEVAENQAAVI